MDNHYLRIIENLRRFVDSTHLSDRAFERSVGWSNGFYGKVKAGKTSFSVERAAKIFEVYPQLNIQWFFTGEGSMLAGGLGETGEMMSPDSTRLLNLLEKLRESKETTDYAELKTEILLLMAENKSQQQKIEKLLELQAKALKKLEELFEK